MKHPQDKTKKIIELANWVITSLDKMAKTDGRSTKNFIEQIITKYVMAHTPLKSKSPKNNKK